MVYPLRVTGRRFPGCGVGCLVQSVVLFAGAGALFLVGQWLFMPWGFYLGGSFHPYPGWGGTAKVHAAAGDFTLQIWMYPTGISRLSGNPTFNGNGWLCTPTGERFTLRLYASILEHSGRDTNGKDIRIELRSRPALWMVTGTTDARPRVTLRGRWQNPDLVTNDEGTLSAAFLPDGRLYDGPVRNQPHAGQPLPFVFHEAPWTAWRLDCR